MDSTMNLVDLIGYKLQAASSKQCEARSIETVAKHKKTHCWLLTKFVVELNNVIPFL
jgi:hypothetical protein